MYVCAFDIAWKLVFHQSFDTKILQTLYHHKNQINYNTNIKSSKNNFNSECFLTSFMIKQFFCMFCRNTNKTKFYITWRRNWTSTETLFNFLIRNVHEWFNAKGFKFQKWCNFAQIHSKRCIGSLNDDVSKSKCLHEKISSFHKKKIS